jgi:hypothetical protein
VREELKELEQTLEAEIAASTAGLASATAAPNLEPYSLSPRKSDITVGDVRLVWLPCRKGDGGEWIPAWDEPRPASESPD